MPRWLDAFPDAIACQAGESPSKFGFTPALIWVRLQDASDFDGGLSEMLSSFPSVPIIVLSDVPTDEEALRCLSRGVRGYCNTYAKPDLLERLSNVVTEGGVWIGESLMQRLLQAVTQVAKPERLSGNFPGRELLTDREAQVAHAIAQGASNKEIARQLEISERTVKFHSGAIFEKLGVRDRLQLSLYLHGHRDV